MVKEGWWWIGDPERVEGGSCWGGGAVGWVVGIEAEEGGGKGNPGRVVGGRSWGGVAVVEKVRGVVGCREGSHRIS